MAQLPKDSQWSCYDNTDWFCTSSKCANHSTWLVIVDIHAFLSSSDAACMKYFLPLLVSIQNIYGLLVVSSLSCIGKDLVLVGEEVDIRYGVSPSRIDTRQPESGMAPCGLCCI